MGSAQCCKKNVQDEGVQELVILEDPNQQTSKLSDLQQEKHSYKKTEECGTPAFPELRSQQSKRSEQCQSLKEIQFIGQVDKEEQILKSTCTLGRKRQKNDSPIVAFEAKNSLKSFDSNRLKKLQSVPEKQLNLKNISSPRDEDSFTLMKVKFLQVSNQFLVLIKSIKTKKQLTPKITKVFKVTLCRIVKEAGKQMKNLRKVFQNRR